MDEETLKFMAAQLRKPHGEGASEIGKKMNEGNRLMNLAALQMLGPGPNERILEIGMGNGFFVKNLFETENSIHYTGCDFSPEMVAEAKQNNAAWVHAGRADFHVAAADQLPVETKSVDKIFTVNTIYFWEDVAAVFSELRRVLKKDGQFIIAVRPKKIMEKFPVTKHGFTMFSRSELETVLQNHGFSPVNFVEEQEADMELFAEKMHNGYLVVKANLTN